MQEVLLELIRHCKKRKEIHKKCTLNHYNFKFFFTSQFVARVSWPTWIEKLEVDRVLLTLTMERWWSNSNGQISIYYING
jgi:hypothetical protein